jgi:thioredoxin reductase
MNRYDAVIVGGGAAGLAGALVLARAGRAVTVLDTGTPRNAPAAHMHGYLSRDGQPPREFLSISRAEVEAYGVRFMHAHVTDVTELAEDEGSAFWFSTSDGTTLTSRTTLVATGLRDVLPDIEGVRKRWGKDVLHCPYCHGYEVRDQPLAVLGGTDEAAEHAVLLRQWSPDVVLLPHDDEVTPHAAERLTARGVKVQRGQIRRLVVSDDHLEAVELRDGHRVRVTAAFLRPRFVPNDLLLSSLDCERDDAGWVRTDAVGQTSVPGVWAAGNVINPRAQVVTAAGEGSAAAIAMNAHLTEEDTTNALAHHQSGV